MTQAAVSGYGRAPMPSLNSQSRFDLDNCREECSEGELQRQSDGRCRYRQDLNHRTVLQRSEARIRPLRDTPDQAAETERAYDQRNQQHSLQCERNEEALYDLRTWQQATGCGVATDHDCKGDTLHPDQNSDSADQEGVNVETNAWRNVNRTGKKQDREGSSKEKQHKSGIEE
jgi:hypothetical protein